MKDWQLLKIGSWLALALVMRYYLLPLLRLDEMWVVIVMEVLVFAIGVYLIQQTAGVIEKTTAVLKDKTGLAGGLLQAIGTAFPDMVIGVVAAILSLQAAATDYTRSINLAIIAASTTFGSNIYNILHAAWCVYRQNLADAKNKEVLMFPGIKWGGSCKPIKTHQVKPEKSEINAAMEILMYLALLTTMVAIGMVLFGKVQNGFKPIGMDGDLFKLSREIAIVVLLASLVIIFFFRKGKINKVQEEENNYYLHKSMLRIWFDLIMSGLIILLAAESLIEAVTHFSEMMDIPLVLTGVITALVGCLGEMIVIHNFSVNPKGRIADALTGVAMDNIVTIIGACLIAIIGGIFLGGDALIVIFVMILFSKAVLMHEIAEMKDSL